MPALLSEMSGFFLHYILCLFCRSSIIGQLIASTKQSVHLWFVSAVWTYALVRWFDLSWLLERYTQSFSAHGWSTFLTDHIPGNITHQWRQLCFRLV